MHQSEVSFDRNQEGLIRFACADTFSGESTYLKQIETGCFDAIFINFSVVDCKAEENVLPAANAGGLGVFAREAFVKGQWFEIGQQVGITARNHLAQVAIKWVLSHQEVNVVVVGIDNPEQLRSNLEVLRDITLNADDYAILQQIQTAPLYQEVYNQKSSSFMQ